MTHAASRVSVVLELLYSALRVWGLPQHTYHECTGRRCSQVRIEDDVICGTDGPEVISSGVPSDVAAVEQLVGSDAQPLLTPM